MACLIVAVSYVFYSGNYVCLIVLNACGYNSCTNYVNSMYRMVTERFGNLGSERVHYTA
jgi:hypothetical protein